jgi:3-dehydroquinate synthase
MNLKMLNKITLNLNERSYDIAIGNNIGNELKHFLNDKKYSKIIVICDSKVDKIYPNYFQNIIDQFEKIIVESGEKSKSFKILEQVCEEILQKNIDRNCLLIALGGGVIGDLTGFVASILLRGIDFIQVPTTLLAMVDSSVGGKTAINSKAGKNLIGSFYQPKLVLIDLNFLKSLPLREFRAGYGEVVKYGLIADHNFFQYLKLNYLRFFNYDQEVILEVVKKCCQLKADIVGNDERESSQLNRRALLNFGHSFAHVLEADLNYSDKMLHGEAVAIGMIMASKMSQNLGLISQSNFEEVYLHLEQCGFEIDLKKFKEDWSIENLVINLYKDKKTQNNKLVFILLDKLGQGYVKKDVELEEFKKIIAESLQNNLKNF